MAEGQGRGFNPLHCGAVVASRSHSRYTVFGGLVSIPFIAGQWSLHLLARLRGEEDDNGFNPLHCGAVVASPERSKRLKNQIESFQSPSLRGSGRFNGAVGERAITTPRVSIPFIAGQWSLPRNARAASVRRCAGFNPLHCGAVVASLPGCGARRMTTSFNPLHCGAVVASRRRR